MDEPDERCLTAYHEAGHAVAALTQRGGKLITISIDCPHPCATAGHPMTKHMGYTGFQVGGRDMLQFVTYAGPWAEARCQCAQEGLDDEEDEGLTIDDYLNGVWRLNRDGDRDDYRQLEDGISPDGMRFDVPTTLKAQLLGRRRYELIEEREQQWSRQLEECCWPVIHTVAQMLLDGCTDVDAITAAVVI
jgi:hypothetical protein